LSESCQYETSIEDCEREYIRPSGRLELKITIPSYRPSLPFLINAKQASAGMWNLPDASSKLVLLAIYFSEGDLSTTTPSIRIILIKRASFH
jgi:hypothetical protein